VEDLGPVFKETSAITNDAARYGVEILHLFDSEILKEFAQTLNESALLNTIVVFGATEFYEYLVVWRARATCQL